MAPPSGNARKSRSSNIMIPLAATAAASLVSLGIYYYLSSSASSSRSSTGSGNNSSASLSSQPRRKDKKSDRMPDPQKRNVAVVVRESSDGLELLRRLPDQFPMEWVNVFVLVHEDGRSSHPLAEDGEGPSSSSSSAGGKVYRQALKMLPETCPKEMVLLLSDEKSVDAMLKQIAAETVVVQGTMAGGVKGVVEGGWAGGVVIVEQGGDGAESEVKGWKTKRAVVKGLDDLEKEWKDRVI